MGMTERCFREDEIALVNFLNVCDKGEKVIEGFISTAPKFMSLLFAIALNTTLSADFNVSSTKDLQLIRADCITSTSVSPVVLEDFSTKSVSDFKSSVNELFSVPTEYTREMFYKGKITR
jgi:hypothetical protein